jgi:23S rRNA A1618 N6-methylase RlmF
LHSPSATHLFINHKKKQQRVRSEVNNLESRDFANKSNKTVLNFGGHNAELWCEGGELGFITQMIYESAKYPMQCFWFTTLVSKQSHLSSIYKTLNKVNAVAVKPSIWLKAKKTVNNHLDLLSEANKNSGSLNSQMMSNQNNRIKDKHFK